MASIDRISNLPDSLLHHIMFFLGSQETVQTCVLSKRWKNLWASLQSLHLDLSNFETNERFMSFVNTLLLLRGTSDLQRFHLRYIHHDAKSNEGTFMSWIFYAIKRNAKVIEIYVPCFERLPQCMFSSASLEELKLTISSIDKGIESRAINLPRLKKLELCVYSDDSDILNKLARGCPALENLYLKACLMNICVVSFPKLKYLNISSRSNSTWVESIRAPNLVSLAFVGFVQIYGETSLEKMPFLMNATIDLQGFSCFDAKKCNLLCAVSNVQNLELSGRAIKDLFQIELPRCPTFFNLTTLSLRHFCMICDSNEVGDFFKHTPNLKKITWSHSFPRHECDMEADQGSNLIKSALFQSKNLDEIEVEFECIDVGTKQLLNTLGESLAELKTTRLILSFDGFGLVSTSPYLTELYQSCLSMVQGKNVVTLLRDNKFVVWSK